MALFTRIVLLTLVSSEISLGQRKHGRNFPVAADVKPGLNFDCPEEFGYYPHPNDCTQYYVCVFGGALLESCTGGLMYSHELQTCDWPRNVGCDSGAEAATTPSSTYSSSSSIRVQEPKVRYTHPPPPPPPAQPAAIVTSRGQPRQLQHNQQDLIKQKQQQQQQLYDEADDALPPAEEIENDRQQRVYRGQPSTIGQVQKDRDGLRHHTNAIPSSSNGVEKIGVISFGSQQQSLQDYRNLTDDIDNFLTNDLTFKRRKRQIKQSHHRFEPNVRQQIFPYELPISLNVRPYSASYSNNRLNNFHNQYETSPRYQDQIHSANHNNTPHYVPYSNVNFSINVNASSNVLNSSSNPYDSSKTSFSYRDKPNFSIFNSPPRVPLPIPELHHPFKLNISYHIRATPSSIDHNIAPSVEYGTSINKYRPATSQHRPATLPKESNRDPTVRLHNYKPSDTNINELKQLIDALTNFRNLQLFLRETQKIEKKPLLTSTPKNNLNSDKVLIPKLKSNETINQNISEPVEKTTLTNIEKINKTKQNNTHTDDAYYYYDDDVEDEIVIKETKPNNTSKYIPLTTVYNETQKDKKINPSTPNHLFIETTTSKIIHNPKFPNQPTYYPTTVRITGKFPPSFTGPIRMPVPNTRHNVDNYRHRHLIPNINWHRYNNHSSNYSPYNKNVPKRVESQSNRPVEQVYSTVRSKPVYNNSQAYDSRYDPYYDLYEELDPELYKSVEYTQHYNNDPPTSQQTYRSTTAPTPTQVLIQEKIPKRGNSGYTQNSYSTQDTYRPSSISSYDKDERYNNNQDDGQGIYQQTNKQSSRRDQNEINYIEEPTSTKRIPTFKTTVSTPRQFSSLKNTKVSSSAESHEVQGAFPNYKLQRNSEYIHTTHTPNDTQIASDIIRPFSISLDVNLTPPQKSFIEKPIPFALPLDAVTPQSFHYVTKLSKSTSIVSTSNPSSKQQISNCDHINCEIIIPTTYSPSTSPFKYFVSTQEIPSSVNEKLGYEKPAETINIQESIKQESEKEGESVTTPQNNFGAFQTTPDFQEKSQNSELKKSIPFDINSTSTFANENLNYLNSNDVINENIVTENNTFSLIPKQSEISPRPNPTKNIPKKVTPTLSYYPTRVSRVNMAIKSIVSFGGLPRPYTKCSDDQAPNAKCKQVKKRVNNRGRGSSHYSNSGPSEEGVVVNRGTSPPRSRPTLKPSTSIVSKASEFIDIYKNPPRRPESIYPQPQPDKTAAKCRKDVCLLPDCSCGGKEIPGDLDVSQVPQMVLLTFDDAVNDLNMGYYSELFEKGRVNPNGCPIVSTFYVSHEWTDYSQVQNLYADGHEMASHTVSHSFGEQFSQKKWTKEIAGQREILSAYGGVRLDDVRGMRAPFLSVGGNKMFKMLYDSNFTYDSSLPVYENKPPSWPYTLDYKLFHDCMIPPCPTRSYPGVWEVPMVMWQDLNGGRCSMGDACSNPSDADGVFKMLMKNFERHYSTNRAPFGLFYHAAWFTQPHHKEGFIHFLDTINTMDDVWLLTNWQAIQWVRDPTPISRLSSFQPFGCNYPERPKRCNNPKVCNLWHKTGVRYMRTCQPCPDIYPWTGNTGIRSSRIDNEIED